MAGFTSTDLILGPRTEVFKLLCLAGKKLGFETVLFGYQHIDRKRRKINGYFYNKNQFQKAEFEFPTVVYNRIPNRKIEHHPDLLSSKKLLEKECVVFNKGFFNKWEVYELLMKNPESSYLLPQTILHPSKRKINQLLNEHSLYIKPVHGSRGDGIIKCNKLSTGEIECHYYYNNKPKINRYTEIESLFEQQFPNGFKGYVVQKEIPLLKKGNSAIDFRVHVNKNHRNSWEVTLICAKFAGKGSLTTHVQRGGSIHTVDELFSKEETKRIHEKLTRTAKLLSTILEKSLQQNVGEIGFDFGIDEEGKVWLFEANSKPGYSVFEHPIMEKNALKVLTYPFKYAFYLHNLAMNKRYN